MGDTDDARAEQGGDAPQMFDDVDAEDTKALRAWMLRVNNALASEGLIDMETRDELHDRAMKATGWESE